MSPPSWFIFSTEGIIVDQSQGPQGRWHIPGSLPPGPCSHPGLPSALQCQHPAALGQWWAFPISLPSAPCSACSCLLPCLSTYRRWPRGSLWPDSRGMTWLSSGLRACSHTKVKGPRKYFWITEFSKWLISICKYIKDIIFGSLIFT